MAASLVKKLLIKPHGRIAIVDAPSGYLDTLGALPEGVDLVDTYVGVPAQSLDQVHLFVKNRADVAQLAPQAMRCVTTNGLLWICYQKRSAKTMTDLTRDVLWDDLSKIGLTGVTLISIDDVWSAMRFRPADSVGT